jgi:gamma-glutamylputrescine oxidase
MRLFPDTDVTMTAAAHAPSYYAATTTLDLGYPDLRGEHRYDCCIIGGGFTGLSAALNLAKRGYSVALLEANKVGWGASGRNGGQVGGEPRQDMEELESKYGKTVAGAHWDLNYLALEEVKSLIADYGIDCDWRDGIISACHREKDVAWYENYVQKLQADYGASYV